MKCEYCEKTFSRKFTLVRHQNTSCPGLNRGRRKSDIVPCDQPAKKLKLGTTSGKNNRSAVCQHCGKQFSKSSNLLRHIRNTCSILTTSNQSSSISNQQDRKRMNCPILNNLGNGVVKLHTAFKTRIASYRFSSSRTHIDYSDFLQEIKQKVFGIIDEYLRKYHTLKISFELFGLYVIPEKGLSDIKSFNTKNKIITVSMDLDQAFADFKEEMITQASEFQERDSGWTLKYTMFLHVNLNKYTQLSASSYLKLPKVL